MGKNDIYLRGAGEQNDFFQKFCHKKRSHATTFYNRPLLVYI